MSLLGNIIWLIFGGFFAGVAYIFGGLMMCLTVVGIPFGIQSMRIGLATFLPFGKEVAPAPAEFPLLRTILDVIWLVLWGWAIALHHLFWALLLGITIIGLPWAKQHLKLVPVALMPFNYELRDAARVTRVELS